MRKLLITVLSEMRQQYKLPIAMLALVFCTFLGCSDENITSSSEELQPLQLSGHILHENVTRANDQGFVTGDRMGIYVVDRINGEAGTLGAVDNRAQNVLFTFDSDTYRWSSPTTIYWRDKQTPVDIYGYYPGVNYIENPTFFPFSVQADQSTEAGDGELSGYEQSDLLWGKAENISFTQEQIVVQYHHILAGVRVQLQKGGGIGDTEWEKLEKIVLVSNTNLQSSVNLATGEVALQGSAVTPIRMAPQSGDQYRAVVIPQSIAASKQLISVTLDGQTYSHSLTSAMQYQAGKLHNFTLTVNKSAVSGSYELSLAYDGITPWMNDENSHPFSTNAYVIVNCPEIGKLEESIRAAGYDPQTLQNLKVTGELTTEDFKVLREGMPMLRNLNLRDSRVRNVDFSRDIWDHGSWGKLIGHIDEWLNDVIPPKAFYGNKSIRSLILPSSLKRIGDNAFREMQLMFSTLEVPEGVTNIGDNAFAYNDYNGVELILPYSIDSIGASAFRHCHFSCELHLNDNIEYIGASAFGGWQNDGCLNFRGVFHIPSKLQKLSEDMFSGLGYEESFTGEIEFPQGIEEIPSQMFGISATGFVLCKTAFKNRVAVTIPDGVKRIGTCAFAGMRFQSLKMTNDILVIGEESFFDASMPFQLELPSQLRSIDTRAFWNCGIEGELIIPENCLTIGGRAFGRNEFKKVTLPSKLDRIGSRTFYGCHQLKEITIPKYVEYIEEGAFGECDALQTVVSLNPEPPQLDNDVWGVEFDKCVLQVPEKSIEAYRQADGWKQFKNITPYRELAFNIPEIITLDKGNTLQGIIRSEGAWEVSDCPSWVAVSPASGTGKAELTVTVSSNSGETREGRIVFRLKDKNYTTYTTVRQVTSGYKEDQTIVLQEASAGAAREVPLFIVGDGYTADDIASGKYLDEMKEQMEHLFSCEPYKTYRNYFTVSTAIAVSPEEGLGGRTRFNSVFDYYSGTFYTEQDKVWQYAEQHGKGLNGRHSESTIVVVMNTNLTWNTTQLESDGFAMALIGKSQDSYPFDQRGYVLHHVGGAAFGHLGDESVSHFTFIKTCTCPGCNALDRYQEAKKHGWYENISMTAKMNDEPWNHLIFHPQYSQYVDVYEGGYRHARGVYRSENMSVMGNTYIPYYNTISRESIVKRIMKYAGETYTFEKFVAKDKREYPEV